MAWSINYGVWTFEQFLHSPLVRFESLKLSLILRSLAKNYGFQVLEMKHNFVVILYASSYVAPTSIQPSVIKASPKHITAFRDTNILNLRLVLRVGGLPPPGSLVPLNNPPFPSVACRYRRLIRYLNKMAIRPRLQSHGIMRPRTCLNTTFRNINSDPGVEVARNFKSEIKLNVSITGSCRSSKIEER